MRAPYCQMLRSSWCWWKSKMHHNTFVIATVLLGPLSNPRNRGEADLICGQILTPASFPFPPSSLPTIISTEVGFPGRGGLLSCCFQLDLGTNTDLISGQILVRSPSTNPGTCYRMLDPPLRFYISRFYSRCSAFG